MWDVKRAEHKSFYFYFSRNQVLWIEYYSGHLFHRYQKYLFIRCYTEMSLDKIRSKCSLIVALRLASLFLLSFLIRFNKLDWQHLWTRVTIIFYLMTLKFDVYKFFLRVTEICYIVITKQYRMWLLNFYWKYLRTYNVTTFFMKWNVKCIWLMRNALD